MEVITDFYFDSLRFVAGSFTCVLHVQLICIESESYDDITSIESARCNQDAKRRVNARQVYAINYI